MALKHISLLIGALSAVISPALAQDLKSTPAPSFKVGDSWVFDVTMENGQAGFSQDRVDIVVERLNESVMMVGIKRDGAPTAFEDHMVGPDWSQRRVVDGEETETTRPFTFPMAVGQSWTVDFVDPTHRGAQTSNHVHRVYKVVGWEDISVPAGKYRALKVEANGIDKATIQVAATVVGGAVASNAGSTSITHTQRGGQGIVVRQTYAEFFYVPEIKNFVKSVEEQYNSDNIRISRETHLMASYKFPL